MFPKFSGVRSSSLIFMSNVCSRNPTRSSTPKESIMPDSKSGTASLRFRFLAAGNFLRINDRMLGLISLVSLIFFSRWPLHGLVLLDCSISAMICCLQKQPDYRWRYEPPINLDHHPDNRWSGGGTASAKWHSQLQWPIQNMSPALSVGETIALDDIAETPIGAQLVTKAAVSLRGEHPFREVDKQFPVQPTRNTEPKDALSGQTSGSRQRNTVVVIPGEEVSLGRSVRIDRMINNCGRAIYDLFACADQPFSEFPIFAGDGMAATVRT